MHFRRSSAWSDEFTVIDVLGALAVLGTCFGLLVVILLFMYVSVIAGCVGVILWVCALVGALTYMLTVPGLKART